MKMTTHIDERLLREAMRAVGARTQREVLERGLRNVLEEAKHREFAKTFERFHVAWDRDGLLEARE